MPYLLVRHKVEDDERWKPVFDHDHGATREQSGYSVRGTMFRNEEPIERSVFNEVHRLVMLEVMADRESVEEAREEGVSARFTDAENEAWAHLIEQDPHVVADAYLYLMHRYVELELSSEPQDVDDE